VLENEKTYEIDFAAPGLDKKDFNVFVEDGRLVVTAEKHMEEKKEDEHFMRKEFSYSSFRRAFSLPDDVKADEVKARYENGILKVWLAKTTSKPKVEPKKVTIQ